MSAPLQGLAEAERRLAAGETLVASVSGGKDSTVVGMALRAAGLPFVPVFADVGWDHAVTYRYVREQLPEILGQPVIEVSLQIALPPELEEIAAGFEERLGWRSPMVRAIIHKAMFPSRMLRWCTQDLKQRPLSAFYETLGGDFFVALGIRAEESAARADRPVWDDVELELKAAYGLPSVRQSQSLWCPIVGLSFADVIGVFQAAGIAPNDLYLWNAARVGCWPCINANRDDLLLLAQDPVRLAIIADLEAVVYALQTARRIRGGKTPLPPPAWFQARVGRGGACWPIAKVIEWARDLPRHPGQEQLFWSPQGGCARWGLCPTDGPPPLIGKAHD